MQSPRSLCLSLSPFLFRPCVSDSVWFSLPFCFLFLFFLVPWCDFASWFILSGTVWIIFCFVSFAAILNCCFLELVLWFFLILCRFFLSSALFLPDFSFPLPFSLCLLLIKIAKNRGQSPIKDVLRVGNEYNNNDLNTNSSLLLLPVLIWHCNNDNVGGIGTKVGLLALLFTVSLLLFSFSSL